MQQNLFLSVLRVAAATYRRNAFTVVAASLAVQLIGVAIGLAAMNSLKLAGVFVLLFVQLATTQMIVGMMTYVVLGERTGTGVLDPGQLMRRVAPKLPMLIGTALLVVFLAGLGILALGVGLLYILLATALAAPIVMCEDVGPWEAIKRSRRLVIQAAGTTFLIAIFANLLGTIVDRVINGADSVPPPLEMTLILNAVISSAIAPLTALMSVELYSRLAQYGPLAFAGTQPPTYGLAASAPAMGSGPWVPVPGMGAAQAAPAMTAAPAMQAMPAMAAYAAPPAPAVQPYGAPVPQAPTAYGQPTPAVPQPYGAAPAYGAQPAYPAQPAPTAAAYAQPAPQAYSAPATPAPQAYGAPAQPAPQAYAAPAPQAYAPPAPAAPAPYGAPVGQPAPAQQPAFAPPQRAHSVAPPGMG